MNTKSFVLFKIIKYLDIGLLGVYYLFGAVIIVSILNKLFKRQFEKKHKVSTPKLILQVAIQAFSIMIMSNILRHTVRSIPYPFEGYQNYQHVLTKETNGGIIIAFAMMTSFTDFKDRASELVKRVSSLI
tara:strand:- start:140 stop:529 length:390 start_codon:yes stop_codon:yes gene_type:complete